MSLELTSRLRKRINWPVLTGVLLVGWVAGISYGHRALERSGTNKGAGELLQIGALPVT